MGYWVDMHVLREEEPRLGSDEGQVTTAGQLIVGSIKACLDQINFTRREAERGMLLRIAGHLCCRSRYGT